MIGLIYRSAAAIFILILPIAALAETPAHMESAAALPDTLRMEDVVNQAIRNNDRATAARYMEKASFQKIGPAGAWDDPMLMVGAINVPTSFDFKMDPMTMKMIGISQNIPYAGQTGLASKAAGAEFEASREDRRGVELDLATSARYAYLDLYYRQRILRYIEDQHSLQQDIVASITAKLRTDQASAADVAAAQADLWRLESGILSAEQEIDGARNNLLSLMGREPGGSLPPLAEPTRENIPATVDGWLDSARQNYPPLRKLNRQSESYAFSAAGARRMRYPMLGLSADYGIRASTPMEKRDNMVGFQATLSLPIFSGRQQGNMARSMESMHQSALAEASQMWRDIRASLVTLHSKAQRLSRSLKLYQERIIPADEDAYRSAFSGYVANRVPFISLLTYSLSIYRDRIMANQIEYELLRTLAEAEQFTSNPDDWDSE
jgi:outer membrane protein TolC